jgi:hypothetical protein
MGRAVRVVLGCDNHVGLSGARRGNADPPASFLELALDARPAVTNV